MKKDQIEEIFFSLKQGNTQLFLLKVSRNGNVQRIGSGTTPPCELSISTSQTPPAIYDMVLESVPEHLPSTNLFGNESSSAASLEYILAFYGGKSVVQDHQAKWELHSGIRIVVNPGESYTHPLLSVLEMIGKQAEKASAQFYFDAMIHYAFGAKSASISDSAILIGPKAYSEKQKLFADYIQTLHAGGQFVAMVAYGKKQSYCDSHHVEYQLEPFTKDNLVSIHLVPRGIKRMHTAQRVTLPEHRKAQATGTTPAQGLTYNLFQMLTSMKVVFFILMLACIVYFTFYL